MKVTQDRQSGSLREIKGEIEDAKNTERDRKWEAGGGRDEKDGQMKLHLQVC